MYFWGFEKEGNFEYGLREMKRRSKMRKCQRAEDLFEEVQVLTSAKEHFSSDTLLTDTEVIVEYIKQLQINKIRMGVCKLVQSGSLINIVIWLLYPDTFSVGDFFV